MLSESRIEQERVRFEAERRKDSLAQSATPLKRTSDGEYWNYSDSLAFKYWLAAIEAQEIMLPSVKPTNSIEYADGQDDYKHEVRLSLEQQGLVVKV